MELVFGVVVEVQFGLVVARYDVADEIDFLLLDIFEAFVGGRSICLFRGDTLAVHLLDDTHRYHSRTESGDIGFAAIFAKRLFNGLGIVGLGHGYFQKYRKVFVLLFYDIHIESFNYNFTSFECRQQNY